MNRVSKLVHADLAWRNGITGRGVGVAVLDTGIYPHPDFTGRITYFQDILKNRRGCYDDCSHGTHVCGILGGSGAASSGKYRGIAPECRLIVLKVLDQQGNGRREDVLRGIQWVIDHREERQIRILNISVGTTKEGEETKRELTRAVECAWDAGIVVVVAAGNMGPDPGSITVPGNSRKVITVGASDDARKPAGNGMKQHYSGCGPTEECVCKPEITAPGSQVISCNAPMRGNHSLYGIKSGTSMATPSVSGAVALLLSKEPHLTNVQVKMRLRDSADNPKLSGQPCWGQLDIAKLLQL